MAFVINKATITQSYSGTNPFYELTKDGTRLLKQITTTAQEAMAEALSAGKEREAQNIKINLQEALHGRDDFNKACNRQSRRGTTRVAAELLCSPLKQDPLSVRQKQKIHDYAAKYLAEGVFKKEEARDVSEVLAKTYERDPNLLKDAQKRLDAAGGNSSSFRRALMDPAAEATLFGIDPKNKEQVFAARIFMKAAIKTILTESRSISACEKRYVKKMSGEKTWSSGAVSTSAKNRLLLLNDPIKSLDPNQPATIVDIVLANTYFETPVNPETGVAMNREQARAIYIKEIERQWENLETRHIIEGLGAAILREKGNIIIGGNPNSLSPFADKASYLGVYKCRHTFYVRSFIQPADNSIHIGNVSTFVHEASHFLFNLIVKNNSSPVALGSKEEALLDKALKSDREHRKNIKDDELTSSQKAHLEIVEEVLYVNLETNPDYFPGGFKPTDPVHRETMRIEAIVRVMELIARGIPLEDIRLGAPNLVDFYFKYSKPLIEQYVKESTDRQSVASFQEVLKDFDTYLAKISTGAEPTQQQLADIAILAENIAQYKGFTSDFGTTFETEQLIKIAALCSKYSSEEFAASAAGKAGANAISVIKEFGEWATGIYHPRLKNDMIADLESGKNIPAHIENLKANRDLLNDEVFRFKILRYLARYSPDILCASHSLFTFSSKQEALYFGSCLSDPKHRKLWEKNYGKKLGFTLIEVDAERRKFPNAPAPLAAILRARDIGQAGGVKAVCAKMAQCLTDNPIYSDGAYKVMLAMIKKAYARDRSVFDALDTKNRDAIRGMLTGQKATDKFLMQTALAACITSDSSAFKYSDEEMNKLYEIIFLRIE